MTSSHDMRTYHTSPAGCRTALNSRWRPGAVCRHRRRLQTGEWLPTNKSFMLEEWHRHVTHSDVFSFSSHVNASFHEGSVLYEMQEFFQGRKEKKTEHLRVTRGKIEDLRRVISREKRLHTETCSICPNMKNKYKTSWTLKSPIMTERLH